MGENRITLSPISTALRCPVIAILIAIALTICGCHRDNSSQPADSSASANNTAQATHPGASAKPNLDSRAQRAAGQRSTAPAVNPALRRIQLAAVSPDASPLTHAKATLWEEDTAPDSLFRWKRSQTLDLPADGKALLETTATGGLALTVRADSWGITGQVIDREALDRKRATALPLRLTLKPVVPIRGVLWNSDGTPAADAEILVLSRNDSGAGLQDSRTTTSAEGRFHLPLAPAGAIAILARTGEMPFQISNVPAPDTETSITLSPIVAVKGQLIGKDINLGQTTAALTLRTSAVGLNAQRRVITDANQQFDLGLLPAGNYTLAINAAPPDVWVPVPSNPLQSSDYTLTFADEKTTIVQIPVSGGITMNGLALDETTSKPVAGVRIYTTPEALIEKRAAAVTTATGEFHLDHLYSTMPILAMADDYYFTGSNSTWRNQDGITSAILPMAPKIHLTGRVTDSMGNAISNGELTCQIISRYGFDAISQPISINDQGEFRTAVFPDKFIRLTATAPSYATIEKTIEVKQENQDNIEIRLSYGSTVRGKVVDFQDAPQPNVPVSIVRLNSNQIQYYNGTNLLDDSFDTAITDPEGRFEFKQTIQGKGIAVLAESNRFAYPVYQLLTADSATSEVILRMPETGPVNGQVVDESGKGIPKADVTLRTASDIIDQNLSVKSGPDGRFTVAYAPTNTSVTVMARAEEYKRFYEERFLDDKALSITLIRANARTLTIYCKDAKTRQPIAGAIVTFNAFSDNLDRKASETNEPGKYLAENAKLTSILTLSAETAGYSTAYKTITSREKQEDTYTLYMRKKSIFIGRAVMANTHEPVPGADIFSSRSPEKPLGKTDPNGIFKIAGEGDYYLTSGETSSARFTAKGDGQEVKDLGDIELHGKEELRIRVITAASGKPVARTKVIVKSQEQNINASGVTDHDGIFKLQAQKNAALKISVPEWDAEKEHSPLDIFETNYKPLGETWEIVIPVGATTLKGTVRKNGKPVWNASVQAHCEQISVWKSMQTGQDGAFELKNLPAGEWKLYASVPGKEGTAAVKVTISEDKAVITKDLNLDNSKKVIGTVYSSEGVPQSDCRVIIESLSLGGSTGTDTNGNYTFISTAPGPFTISASHPTEGHSAEIKLDNSDEPGDTTRVDIILEKGTGAVECTAVSAVSGITPESFALELKSEDLAPISGDSGSQSGQSIVIRNLKAGAYTAKVSATGYASVTRAIQVEAGQTVTLNESLIPASYVIIRVKNSRGYSLPDVPVTITGGSAGSRTEKTDKQGLAKFDGIEPGAYNASATASDGKTASGAITISPQPTAQFELLLP